MPYGRRLKNVMATPIDNKALLQQFLEGQPVEEPKQVTLPVVEKPSIPSAKKAGKMARFSVTVPTELASMIRQQVTNKTIQQLSVGESYNLSRFFCEAAAYYLHSQEKN